MVTKKNLVANGVSDTDSKQSPKTAASMPKNGCNRYVPIMPMVQSSGQLGQTAGQSNGYPGQNGMSNIMDFGVSSVSSSITSSNTLKNTIKQNSKQNNTPITNNIKIKINSDLTKPLPPPSTKQSRRTSPTLTSSSATVISSSSNATQASSVQSRLMSRPLQKLHPIAPKPPSTGVVSGPSVSQHLSKNGTPVLPISMKKKKIVNLNSSAKNEKAGSPVATTGVVSNGKETKLGKKNKSPNSNQTNNCQVTSPTFGNALGPTSLPSSTNMTSYFNTLNNLGVSNPQSPFSKQSLDMLNPLFLDSPMADINSAASSTAPVFSSIDPSSLTNLSTTSSSSHNTSQSDTVNANVVQSCTEFGSTMLPALSSNNINNNSSSSHHHHPDDVEDDAFSHKPKSFLSNENLLDSHLFSPPASPFFFSSLGHDPLVPGFGPSFSGSSSSFSGPLFSTSQPGLSMTPFHAPLHSYDSEMLDQDSVAVSGTTTGELTKDGEHEYKLFSKPIFSTGSEEPSPSASSSVPSSNNAISSGANTSNTKNDGNKNKKTKATSKKKNATDSEAKNKKKTANNKKDSTEELVSVGKSKPKSKVKSVRDNDPPTAPSTTLKVTKSSPSSSSSSQSLPTSASPPPLPLLDLSNNPDYIALTSALSLLQTQRSRARTDILQLHRLKSEALADPSRFIAQLRKTGKVAGAPRVQRVVRAPMVHWGQYGGGESGVGLMDTLKTKRLEHAIGKGVVESGKGPFGEVRLFDEN